MAEENQKPIQLRTDFYRDGYKRLILALFILMVVNITIAGMLFYQFATRPAPKYFSASDDGRIMPLYPLSDAGVITTAELLQWAQSTAISAYSFNYVNYQEILQQLQNQFTAEGWQSYESNLRNYQVLENLTQNKFVVSAQATAAPRVIDKDVINGVYVWKIEMPIVVNFINSVQKSSYDFDVLMLVSRVQVSVDNPKGVAIQNFTISLIEKSQV